MRLDVAFYRDAWMAAAKNCQRLRLRIRELEGQMTAAHDVKVRESFNAAALSAEFYGHAAHDEAA